MGIHKFLYLFSPDSTILPLIIVLSVVYLTKYIYWVYYTHFDFFMKTQTCVVELYTHKHLSRKKLIARKDTNGKNSKIYAAGHRGMVGSAIVREL